MTLPLNSKDAHVRLLICLGDFGQLLEDDELPAWAAEALCRAFSAIPILREVDCSSAEEGDAVSAYQRGINAGMVSEHVIPFLCEVAEFARARATLDPTNIAWANQSHIASAFFDNVRTRFQKSVAVSLLGQGSEGREVVRGLSAWHAKGTFGSIGNLGNLATLPYLYIGCFWRDFIKFRTIKESYYGLLCMFDGEVALAGTFESFRKRAKAIGLKYPKI